MAQPRGAAELSNEDEAEHEGGRASKKSKTTSGLQLSQPFEPSALPSSSMPTLSDSIELLLVKLKLLEEVVQSGGSIAQKVGYQNQDAVAAAGAQMCPLQAMAWKALEQGTYNLPVINWSTDTLPAPTSQKSLKVAQRRAEALNRIYDTTRAREGHVVWFTKHHEHELPLVKAMARVIGAEIHSVGGQSKLSADELLELQALNKILSIASQVASREGNHAALRGKVGGVIGVLGVRRRAIQRLKLAVR